MCDGTLYSAGDQKRSYTGIRGRAPGKTSYYYQPLTSGMCGTYPSEYPASMDLRVEVDE